MDTQELRWREMADFSIAYRKVARWEGGYSHEPGDYGEETYRGVSRRWHPVWSGWKIIDRAKAEAADFPRNLENRPGLEAAVQELYRRKYWDRVNGEQISDQKLADEMLDIAVNLGVDRAVRFLQRALNLLNNRQRLYRDVTVDGRFGTETMAGVRACIETRPIRYLLTALNILQGAHYVEQMEAHETQERFIGWLDRVELMHR